MLAEVVLDTVGGGDLPVLALGDDVAVGVAGTLTEWQTEIMAYFDTGGASNGPTEAVNLLIEKVRRIGHGYRNFANIDYGCYRNAESNGLRS